MPDVNARDTKLVQYLNEAHTKERQLEQALEAHIAMTEIATYRKRLQQHLTETKRHAREVERRIKQLGGRPRASAASCRTRPGVVQEVAATGAALAQGQVHMPCAARASRRRCSRTPRRSSRARPRRSAPTRRSRTLAKIVGDRDTEQAREGDPARGEAHGGLPREADPAAHAGGRAGRDPGAERNGGRRRTTTPPAHHHASGTRTSRKRTSTTRKRSTTSSRSSGSRAQRHAARPAAAPARPVHRAAAPRAQRVGASSRASKAAPRPRRKTARAAPPRGAARARGNSSVLGGARRRRRRASWRYRCAFAQSHRPRKPACVKSFNPAAAKTVVTVRPVRGARGAGRRSPSAVHAPTQRLHVTSSPTRALEPPAARPLAAHRIVHERLAHPGADPSRGRSPSRSRRWRRSAGPARRPACARPRPSAPRARSARRRTAPARRPR